MSESEREIAELEARAADAYGVEGSEEMTLASKNLLTVVAAKLRSQAADLSTLRARVAEVERELAWYGEQARLCRLIHREGDAGRQALSDDGGKRANAILTRIEGESRE